MPARIIPSRGGKPDKLMRDAIILELHDCAEDSDGRPTKKLRLVARKLVNLALHGDIGAIREVNDRVDGRPPQQLTGANEGPLSLTIQWKTDEQSSSTIPPDRNSSDSTSEASGSPASSPTAAQGKL